VFIAASAAARCTATPCTRALGDDVRQQSNFTECSMEEVSDTPKDQYAHIKHYVRTGLIKMVKYRQR